MVYHCLQHGPVGHTLFFNLPGEKLGPGANVSKRNYLHFSVHLIKGFTMPRCIVSCDIYLDHLVKLLLAGFLHCEVTLSLFCSG